MTFEEYLRKTLDETGCIDHAVRILALDGERLRFYIHPSGVDGDTPDFYVDGNCLTEITADGMDTQDVQNFASEVMASSLAEKMLDEELAVEVIDEDFNGNCITKIIDSSPCGNDCVCKSREPIIITFEGIDGSGKGTQSKLLYDGLKLSCGGRYSVGLLSFPNYEGTFGKLIGKYLNGEYKGVPRQVVALLYAMDRWETFSKLPPYDIIICDRYVTTNVLYQSAWLFEEEREQHQTWIRKLEHSVLGLQKPDLQIILDVPVEVSKQLVAQKKGRSYTDKTFDRYEANTELLDEVRQSYLGLAKSDKSTKVIKCYTTGDEGSFIRPVEDIYKNVYVFVLEFLLKQRGELVSSC